MSTSPPSCAPCLKARASVARMALVAHLRSAPPSLRGPPGRGLHLMLHLRPYHVDQPLQNFSRP
eukprot:4513064-Alexandrium_andersonii.AAC.1